MAYHDLLEEKAEAAGWISVPEAARRAGVSVRTMWRWREEKRVKSREIGSRWRIWAEDIEGKAPDLSPPVDAA